jgi:Zn finger protein HypA/HybF involved in hydrogenase expression
MSLKQRKFLFTRNLDYSKCGCGGSYIEKDHGKWVGYFCPKCGSGGSRNKKY